MKKFQVMVTIGDGVLIDGTNKKSEVDEWVKAFHERSEPASELKVFQLGEVGYTLVHSVVMPSAKPEYRPIGFGRW